MAQTTHFIRFIEDTNLEYIYPIDKIQSIKKDTKTSDENNVSLQESMKKD